jgi:transposase-like protein
VIDSEDIMTEANITIDHATIRRWASSAAANQLVKGTQDRSGELRLCRT